MAGDGERNRRRRVNDLSDVVLITIGMKVMVTSNIKIDLDVMDGA